VDEIAPGILHWSARHPRIRVRVHSAYVVPARALIDPLVPEEGLEAFAGLPRPEVVLLTNRHHFRHSDRFAQAFGCPVRASEPSMADLGDRGVEAFAFGAEVAPGVTALEIGAICPDEAALHVAHGDGALAVADGLVRWRGRLGFVPDRLLGGDAEGVKAGLRAAYRRVAGEHAFDALLLAHGEPLASGARAAVLAFAGD
jgi:hypothetical protein